MHNNGRQPLVFLNFHLFSFFADEGFIMYLFINAGVMKKRQRILGSTS